MDTGFASVVGCHFDVLTQANTTVSFEMIKVKYDEFFIEVKTVGTGVSLVKNFSVYTRQKTSTQDQLNGYLLLFGHADQNRVWTDFHVTVQDGTCVYGS